MLKNKLYSLCSILWSMLWISLCILSLGTEPGLEHAHRVCQKWPKPKLNKNTERNTTKKNERRASTSTAAWFKKKKKCCQINKDKYKILVRPSSWSGFHGEASAVIKVQSVFGPSRLRWCQHPHCCLFYLQPGSSVGLFIYVAFPSLLEQLFLNVSCL